MSHPGNVKGGAVDHSHDWRLVPSTRNLKSLEMVVCGCGATGWRTSVPVDTPQQIERYLEGRAQ